MDSDILPDGLVSIRATIPDTLQIETIDTSRLPSDWKDEIIPVSLQELGTSWANRGKRPVFRVPSAVIEHEWNYVLNPRHPDFSKITWDTGIAFSFDPRLLK